jgi:flavin reductase (DIM6/NTAB) family NADH-FMN oxidoreductase RutF
MDRRSATHRWSQNPIVSAKDTVKNVKKSIGPGTYAMPTPTWVVGTYDSEGKPNVMTAAWGGICNSRPPNIYVSLRKATYSHGNIVARKAFTVSVTPEKYVREADYIGLVSGRDVDKFAKTGLTPVRSEVVDAPYVGEFPLVIECRLVQAIELGLHTQFIGEVVDVKADEDVLAENGKPDIRKVRPVMFGPGTNVYCGIGEYLGPAFSIGKEL